MAACVSGRHGCRPAPPPPWAVFAWPAAPRGRTSRCGHGVALFFRDAPNRAPLLRAEGGVRGVARHDAKIFFLASAYTEVFAGENSREGGKLHFRLTVMSASSHPHRWSGGLKVQCTPRYFSKNRGIEGPTNVKEWWKPRRPAMARGTQVHQKARVWRPVTQGRTGG